MFPFLSQRKNQLSGTLSGGEQQMLAIGRALMAQPSLIMLDEPSMGLAPLVVKSIFSAVATLRDDGCTILIVEQNSRAVLRIADRGYVMETGTIVLEGTAKELLNNTDVRRAYLGKDYSTINE
jgi:branched-chain amino acid transport system ATP-binding protein